MYAHYTATKMVAFVTISTTAQPIGVRIPVESKTKAEARKIAKQYNAKCWNF